MNYLYYVLMCSTGSWILRRPLVLIAYGYLEIVENMRPGIIKQDLMMILWKMECVLKES